MRKSSVPVVAMGVVAAFALAACSSSGGGSKSSTPAGASTGAGSTAASSAPASSGSSSSSGGGSVDGKGAKIGIILPDTTSSPRWVTADPTALAAACHTDNLSCNIQNAGGSAAKMQTIAR